QQGGLDAAHTAWRRESSHSGERSRCLIGYAHMITTNRVASSSTSFFSKNGVPEPAPGRFPCRLPAAYSPTLIFRSFRRLPRLVVAFTGPSWVYWATSRRS